MNGELLNKINGGLEAEEKFRLIKGLLSETLKDTHERIDVSLLNQQSILEFNDFYLGQSNRKHFGDAKLSERLLIE